MQNIQLDDVSAKKLWRWADKHGLPSSGVRGIEKSLDALLKKEKLKLSALSLEAIPDEIGMLTSLKELDIQHNELSEFPECICNLHNLERLNIALNCIKSLPSTLVHLRLLKELDISFNFMHSFSDEVGLLPNLEVLIIENIADKRLSKRLLLNKNLVIKLLGPSGTCFELDEEGRLELAKNLKS